MAAAWFKGVQRWICLDYNDTVYYFINSLRIPLALSIIATIDMCAPEPITVHHSHVRTRANHCRVQPHNTTYLKKQVDLRKRVPIGGKRPITKLYGKPRDVVAGEQGKVVG